MEVNKKDIEDFSKKLLNIKKPPILWSSSIRIDGNCFFHAIDYANTGILLPKKSNKIIELRQQIVSTMNKPIISGVTYEEFMNARKNGKSIPWPYSENDVVAATAKYYKKVIIVISMNHYGGVTMFRPKGIKIKNPLFLICHANHFVPFHSDKVQITNVIRNRLEQIEEIKIDDEAVVREDGVYTTSFLLRDLLLKDSLSLTRKKIKNRTKQSNTVLTRRRSHSQRYSHSHSRSHPMKNIKQMNEILTKKQKTATNK